MFEIATALPSPSGTKGAPDVAANPGANAASGAAETSPFAAFQTVLAQQMGASPAVSVPAPVAGVPMAPGAAAAVAVTAMVAGLPEGGKGLPVAAATFAVLPTVPVTDDQPGTDADVAAAVRQTIARSVLPVAFARSSAKAAVTTPEQPGDRATDADASDEADQPAATAPVISPILFANIPALPVPQDVPAADAGVAGVAPRAGAVAAIVLAAGQSQAAAPSVPAVAPAILSTMFERQDSAEAVTPALTPAAHAVQVAREPASTAQALRAARAGTAAEDTASPQAIHAAKLPIARDAVPPVDNAAVTVASAALSLTDAAPTAQGSPTPQATARPERIDFATLVDSIARAREEGAGNAVSVAVAHADFGKVSLRFENGDNGLSVSMASADPGFARAVAASAQADGGTFNADSQQQQSQSQQRTPAGAGSAQASLSGDGAAQSRNGNGGGAGRPDSATPASQRAATAVAQSDETLRDGIFA